MIITELDYRRIRTELIENMSGLSTLEEYYMLFLQQSISSVAQRIVADFDKAEDLKPFWQNYPPIQRGKSPTGTSIPWSEVGQTAIGSNIIRALAFQNSEITYPGLPSGSDIRFLAHDALVHLDVKITGPNDMEGEVVASPNQVSGDGISWQNGVINSPVIITGQRASMIFQPELPLFYIINGRSIPCLTFFIKGIYGVKQLGHQPLTRLDLLCVPNGLMTFDGPKYMLNSGLFIPGKDIISHPKKRVRVRIEPLGAIAAWRTITIWQR